MHGLNLRTTEDQSHSLRLIPGNDIILIIGFVLAFNDDMVKSSFLTF